MAVQITAVRLSGGATHQHITDLWWSNPTDNTADASTRAQIVKFLDQDGGSAYVADASGHRAPVGVVKPTTGENYVRTYADGVWTDNLLALPRR